jgi:HEPN domain-containing protein
MKKTEIEKMIQARLEDARILYETSRFHGSVYLCGYAVELGLKARICDTLQWDEYPSTAKYQTFKTHDLEMLLHLTGMENEIKIKYFAEWSIVAQWNPEMRYIPVGNILDIDATRMLEASKKILEYL